MQKTLAYVVSAVLFLGTSVWLCAQASPQQAEPANPQANSTVGDQDNASDGQLPQSDTLSREANPGDPLLDVPPLPKGKVTMEGGVVTKIDPIRNHLMLAPFGAKEKMKIAFDERTHFYRDGRETTQAAIHQGDRVYVDTMLDGPRIFARNIHIVSERSAADVIGQVVAFNGGTKRVIVRDRLSGSDISMGVTQETRVDNLQGQAEAQSQISPGTIVSVHFVPGSRASSTVDEIKILARPGQVFTFSGKITNVDLRNGMMAVNNQSDNEIYDIAFDPKDDGNLNQLRMGALVTVKASFTGQGYKAESVTAQ